jgi:HlyD family secretion protein
VLATINNRGSIEASINGIVLSLKVKKGESVTGNSFSVGTEMMTIADMSQLVIRADVGENDINKVVVGDSADIKVDAYNNRTFKGVVKSIANSTKTGPNNYSATGDITNYEVKILLDTTSYRDLAGKSFPFRPGMNTSVEIRTRKAENVLAVPIAAVNARVRDSDKSMEEKRKEDQAREEEGAVGGDQKEQLEEVVFILQKDNTVKKVIVKTGIQDISYIEIQSGINEGDQVVIGPYAALSKTLKDGMKVKLVPRDKLFEK